MRSVWASTRRQNYGKHSPVTFARCEALNTLEAYDSMQMELRSIPPPAVEFQFNETAVNIAIYNAYLGRTVVMTSATEEDPTAWDFEAFNLFYQTFCIAAGLIERQKYHE